MISENKNEGNQGTFRGLENDIPQNHNLNQDDLDREAIRNTEEDMDNADNNETVETPLSDPQLEEQWLAVRDEYLAHYPELEDENTEYEKGSFHTIVDILAKKRQRTPKEIQNEIMDWSR